MAFIIVNSANSTVERLLRAWSKPSHGDRTTAQKYFIRKLGPGTYLMEANAGTLALLYDLKLRYKEDVYIYVAKPISVRPEFPEEVIKVIVDEGLG